MALREVAENDLAFILEGDAEGFRWPIVITNPSGTSNSDTLYGFSNDISQLIDPETGQAVSGRLASVSVRINRLTEVGLTLPQGIAESSSKPWTVTFNDILGTSHTFKVAQSNPDRALGIVVLLLEKYS